MEHEEEPGGFEDRCLTPLDCVAPEEDVPPPNAFRQPDDPDPEFLSPHMRVTVIPPGAGPEALPVTKEVVRAIVKDEIMKEKQRSNMARARISRHKPK